MIRDITLAYDGNEFKLPARQGNSSLSYALGYCQQFTLPTFSDDVPLESILLDIIKDRVTQAEKVLLSTVIMRAGPSIFWISREPHGPELAGEDVILNVLTAAALPDDSHLEDMFDLFRKTTFPSSLLFSEITRLQEVRAAVKVFG